MLRKCDSQELYITKLRLCILDCNVATVAHSACFPKSHIRMSIFESRLDREPMNDYVQCQLAIRSFDERKLRHCYAVVVFTGTCR